jgi:preprotein translocase subunit SecA
MSDRAPALHLDAYPERQERRPSAMEKLLLRMAYLPARLLSQVPIRPLPGRVRRPATAIVDLSAELRALRYELRRNPRGRDSVAGALALAAKHAPLQLNLTADERQRAAALALALGGRCVGLSDVGAWPLAVAMASVPAALAGIPVHVIHVTGHVASRDATAMRPLFEALGLSVGIVDETTPEAERRAAYAADITYCTHREIALDYLRDRLVLKGKPRALRLRMESLTSHNPRAQHLMLRGLQFAIVAEAETILVDAAQTPITISGNAGASQETAWLAQALQLARGLDEEPDYRISATGAASLLDAGREKLAGAATRLAGLWQGARRREAIVELALVAERGLRRDEHYQVSGKDLQAPEELLRSLAGDPGNVRLLRMLLEIKEGCQVTGAREMLARIGYQRFFRRYLRLSGLGVGTSAVAAELWAVYRLKLLRIHEPGPALDVRIRDRYYRDKQRAGEAVASRVREFHARGCPVLVVTRTPQASAAWAEMLESAGLPGQRLLGSQNAEEETLLAMAAERSRITIAPYFAARCTKVARVPDTEKLGGLRIIQVQPLAYDRHLDSLVRRCIPKGVPGSVQRMVLLDDDLLGIYVPAWWRRPGMPFSGAMLRYCQRAAARDHAHARGELLRMEDYLGDIMAFAGGQT